VPFVSEFGGIGKMCVGGMWRGAGGRTGINKGDVIRRQSKVSV